MTEKSPLKIVVVGDGAVGKTSMIASYATNTFDDQHVPTVYDLYKCAVEVTFHSFCYLFCSKISQNKEGTLFGVIFLFFADVYKFL